ncbi:sugar phosphate isomerase/epimerase family protein [Aquiflexum sp.]|uniref:sugar phosphate isomerase/epimerase family protein n=1 Tax=Aquiflexum sp. TaxID=1872584 RepID=UPI00359322D8
MKRRGFMGLLPLTILVTSSNKFKLIGEDSLPISANEYNWITFYNRSGKTWGENWDACLYEFAKTGIQGFEPSLKNSAHLQELIPYLDKYKIQLPSFYVGSLMHEEDEANKSIDNILEIAGKAKKLGTKIIVTNPNPIQWGGGPLKNDDQLYCQSSHLDQLGKEISNMGMKLAYHTHDVELRAGAREFHHVLQNTHPENLHFCMDVHWVYRGSENSQWAVFDTLKMYGKRIVSFHLRQSKNGIWTDTFNPHGDIDYVRFAAEVKKMGINAHLVIEQCLEEKSIQQYDVVKAHQINLKEVQNIFKA